MSKITSILNKLAQEIKFEVDDGAIKDHMLKNLDTLRAIVLSKPACVGDKETAKDLYWFVVYNYKTQDFGVVVCNVVINKNPLDWLSEVDAEFSDEEYTILWFTEIDADTYLKYKGSLT